MLSCIIENSDSFIKRVHKLIVRFFKNNNLISVLERGKSINKLSYYNDIYFNKLVPLIRGSDITYYYQTCLFNPIVFSITDKLPCQNRTLTIKYKLPMQEQILEINIPLISLEMFYFSCIVITILISKFKTDELINNYDEIFAKIPEFFKCNETN